MRVRTLQSITTPRGEIPAGEILNIPEHLVERLRGKVEPITFHGAVEIVTPEGDRVWIATEPEAAKLIPSGAVFFLGDEIMEFQKVGKEAARAALMVKQVFGSEVQVTKIGPPEKEKWR